MSTPPGAGSATRDEGETLRGGFDSGIHSQNIETVVDFYAREEKKIGHPQRALERMSQFLGRPIFVGMILLFITAWVASNLLLTRNGLVAFDPPPFQLLQGIVSLGGLLAATLVLIRQNRLAKLADQRAHLDMKVTLLTEQKVAKLIDMLEELRRDLPNVRDRHDPAAAVLQQPLGPEAVLATLHEHGDTGKHT